MEDSDSEGGGERVCECVGVGVAAGGDRGEVRDQKSEIRPFRNE